MVGEFATVRVEDMAIEMGEAPFGSRCPKVAPVHLVLGWLPLSYSMLDGDITCIYNLSMLFRWDERKRRSNLKTHKLDFRDAPSVFNGPTVTYEDDRFDYGEQRFVTLGLLRDIAVSIVHTETDTEIRLISFRKATRNEETYLFKSLQN